ncbi:MAG: SEL1-like repeat protein [Butyrivibrio sp.]|nr:SEL1-like repeat protein [Butyrivibrio sp.]
MKLVCPDCGRQYESGKFCLECGGKLKEVTPELVCPSCGYKAKSGKFCPECGTKLTEQIATVEETSNPKSVEHTFNEKDPRFAKYYDKKGSPRTIPQEERDVAIEELTLFANQDIAEAKMLLGNILMSDVKNEDTAFKAFNLLKEAEEAGDKFAYYLIGYFYYMGAEPLLEQDHSEAEKRLLEYYKEYEDDDAAQLLAELYAFSIEKCDYKKAFDYATIAAEDDECGGYLVLGSLYLNGWGVEKDVNKALENYKMAAAYGDETAMNQIGFIYMGNEGIDENPEQSLYWFNEASKKNSAVGMYNLGYCYKNGYGTETDVEQAAEWFKKSAELGYVDAMCELGEYYQGTLIDLNKAKMWYLKAAELGHAEAQNKLGVLYADIENDYKEAIKWYKKAMEQDSSWAYRNYAFCLWNGNGVKENKKKAIEMMRKAISLGHPDAESELGEMQQELANSKMEGTKVSKEAQQKNEQINEKTKEAKIDNVRFETDGRKTLYVDFDCILNKDSFLYKDDSLGDFYETIIICILYKGKQLYCGYYDSSEGVIHERVIIKDFELKLNIDQINEVPLTIEVRRDKEFDFNSGIINENNLEVIATDACVTNLYYEFHVFGKNVLEIK